MLHTCNPSYSEDTDQENFGSRASQEKELAIPDLNQLPGVVEYIIIPASRKA
jgi:hypothetical protein